MAAGKERVPNGRDSLPLVFTMWKSRTPLAVSVSYYCFLAGVILTMLLVIEFIFQGWLVQLIAVVPGLSELLRHGPILLVSGIVGRFACYLYERKMPFGVNVAHRAINALHECGVIPDDLIRADFACKVKAHRRKQICVFMFSVRYPGRGFSDVMPMVRGIESSFPGATSCDLIETEGRAHKRYPLTLVVHYGGDDQ
jgi:hypothetical protein